MAKRQSVGTTAVVRVLANSLDKGSAKKISKPAYHLRVNVIRTSSFCDVSSFCNASQNKIGTSYLYRYELLFLVIIQSITQKIMYFFENEVSTGDDLFSLLARIIAPPLNTTLFFRSHLQQRLPTNTYRFKRDLLHWPTFQCLPFSKYEGPVQVVVY